MASRQYGFAESSSVIDTWLDSVRGTAVTPVASENARPSKAGAFVSHRVYTVRAQSRLLSITDNRAHLVVCQVAWHGEPFIAIVTLERFDACVYAHVRAQVSYPIEHLVAARDIARVLLLRHGCHIHHWADRVRGLCTLHHT